MIHPRIFMICLAVLLTANNAEAQGCSDAGFCTVGAIKLGPKPDTSNKHQHQISLISSHGQGDDGVYVMTNTIQYDGQWNKHWSFQGRLVTNYASGNLGTASGLGDIILALSYGHRLDKNWSVSYTAGIKLPLQQSDATSSGKPLPMQYQPSLGTTDLVFGAAVQNKRWHIAAGWQQPLTKTNNNGFVPQLWPNTESAANYPPSNKLERKADILARASYTILTQSKFHWSGGLLGIVHLGNDAYTDPIGGRGKVELIGSDGLTLNATTQAQWQLNRKWRIGLTAAVPLVVRNIRPDGLTRSWVLAPEVAFRF